MPCAECGHIAIENRELQLCASCNKALRDVRDLYPEVRKRFLEMCIRVDATCPVKGTHITLDSDIHHKCGRIGFADDWAREHDIPLLIDPRFFLAVSREGHQWIEEHPGKARLIGYSLPRNQIPFL